MRPTVLRRAPKLPPAAAAVKASPGCSLLASVTLSFGRADASLPLGLAKFVVSKRLKISTRNSKLLSPGHRNMLREDKIRLPEARALDRVPLEVAVGARRWRRKRRRVQIEQFVVASEKRIHTRARRRAAGCRGWRRPREY